MRVSTYSFSGNFINQLNQLAQQQNQLQMQASSGQKVTLPEDNPGVMGEVLNQQTEMRADSQYQTNINADQHTATATANVINSLKTISDRANEIATQVDGLTSPDQYAALTTEVNSLLQQAVQVANTQNQGSYLLGGTATSQPPYVATTDSSGNVTAVTYQGNTQVAQSEIAQGVTVTGQTLGTNTTGSGPAGLITDSRSGADFLNHLIALRNDLQSQNQSAIKGADAANLQKDDNNILTQISANGAVQSRLQAAGTLAAKQGTSLNSQISNEANADLAQTLTQLSQAQNAYQAALVSGTKIMGLSILDYIR